MQRQIIDSDRVHPAIREKIATRNQDIIEEVEAAIGQNDILVVGMAQNPYPKKARALLKSRGLAFEYLKYGSYLSKWRRRNALKMWSGWPTFPMVFIKGTLVGGHSDLLSLAESGELDQLLAE